MSDPTALAQADAMIEKAWGHSISALETLAVRRPAQDPLLTATMHIRSALVISDNEVAVHQDRLHALTRPGHVPAFYDLERATLAAVDLRVVQAESLTALRAIRDVIEAREAATDAEQAPAVRLAQAAVARSSNATHSRPQPSGQPAPPPPAGPPSAGNGPQR